MSNQIKYGIFYKSQGQWTPLRTDVKRQPRTFTSTRELERYINSSEFSYTKNRVLKSAITVRKVK
jgi:hypothetical protein